MAKISLGISLFSLQGYFARGLLDYEGLIRTAKELGAEGYEIVGAQSVPSYPYVSDDFLGKVKAINDKYGMKLIAYGANSDKGLLKDRDLTDKEMLEKAIIDLKAAHKLGCTVMRSQYLMSSWAFEHLAPYAEEYGVKVGIEIHNPDTPSTPRTQEFIDAIDRSGSKYLGLVMDLGAFATRPNKPYWDLALKQGAPEAMLQKAADLRYADVPFDEARQQLLDAGANDAVMGAFQNMYGFVTFRKDADLEGLKRVMPYIIHFHGKFHYMNEKCQEASIPYNEILPVIHDSDYSGWIMSENEGGDFYEEIGMTKRHLMMEKSILS